MHGGTERLSNMLQITQHGYKSYTLLPQAVNIQAWRSVRRVPKMTPSG